VRDVYADVSIVQAEGGTLKIEQIARDAADARCARWKVVTGWSFAPL
jgi:hypothetical protein